MIISQIVAAGRRNEIGKENALLWHLPNDMKFFKNTTWAMPVIMGRKTFESLGGKPLKGRANIILTRNHGWTNPEISIVHSVEDAIREAEKYSVNECFVIGGAEIYRLFLPYSHRVYLTRVQAEFDADSYYPVLKEDEWELVSKVEFDKDEKHPWPYSFEKWEKKQK